MSQTICVLGLGYIGLPTAVTLAQAGYTVHGADVNPAVLGQLTAGRSHFEEPGLDEALAAAWSRLTFGETPIPADVFILCVQSPCRVAEGSSQKTADLRYVESAARMVGAVLRPGNLVVLESTVPPRTTRMVERVCAEVSGLSPDEFFTAHCPERVIPGQILRELRENDRVIGASNPQAAERARDLYARVVTGGRIRLTDDITAEVCKLVENTYRDINIAYANELSVLCEGLGIDVYGLIGLANCHPRVNVHQPGAGVGGHCIPVDPWFLLQAQDDGASLIRAARLVNDQKPRWLAGQIAQNLPEGAEICVLGLAYKPDVDDLRESPGLKLCRLLRERGFRVSACEPNVQAREIQGFRNLSAEDALYGGALLVLAVGHRAFAPYRDAIASRRHYDCVGFLRQREGESC